MKKRSLLLYIIVCTTITCANATDENAVVKELCNKVEKLELAVSNQKIINEKLQREDAELSRKYDTQRALVDSLSKKLTETNDNVNQKSSSLNQSIEQNKQELNIVGQDLIGKTYWGIALFVILAIVSAIVYMLLNKRTKTNADSLTSLKQAQETLQLESVKIDQKLVDLLNKQIESVNDSKQELMTVTSEPDHSLVLKISTEIAKLQNNVAKMDSSVRGHKQLKQSLDRMLNNMKAKGYEIVNLIGQDYNEGMQYEVRFIPDDTLPEGKRIISGVDQLQVNYQGKMIQHAKIVVRQNLTD